jgi:hypothetical protein
LFESVLGERKEMGPRYHQRLVRHLCNLCIFLEESILR